MPKNTSTDTLTPQTAAAEPPARPLTVSHVVYFTADAPTAAADFADRWGFHPVATADDDGTPDGPGRAVALRQGGLNLVVCEGRHPDHPAARFVERHGDGFGDLALRTDDVRTAVTDAVGRGARVVAEPTERDGLVCAVLGGFGDIRHTLVERPGAGEAWLPGFTPVADGIGFGPASDADPMTGLTGLDHVAVAVEAGTLDETAAYYHRVFGFRTVYSEIMVRDDEAMDSNAVRSPSGDLTLTLISPSSDHKPGHIGDFLSWHGGPGVHHLAFASTDLTRTVDILRDRGVAFLDPPDLYYERLVSRVDLTRHPLEEVQPRGILADREEGGLLYQIFTRSSHPRRTLIFEVIERDGAQAFGNRNVRALYDAIQAENAEIAGQVAVPAAPAPAPAPAPASLLTPADAEEAAARLLPADIWDFVRSGAGTERTLTANTTMLDQVSLLPRVLVDVSAVSTAGRLLGSDVPAPMAVAPMAYQRAVHPDGELAAAAGALAAGVPFTVSTFSSVAVEDIAVTGADLWFQLYWLRDRGAVAELVARAEQAGARALMLTVDTPRMGRRLADMRRSFTLPPDVTAAHFSLNAERLPAGVSALAAQTAALVDPALSWADLDWLRERTSLPLICKGILHPDDAVRAARAGTAAVVVSNHGGRQLDGAAASVTALPAVVTAVRAAVGDKVDVLLDGGVRTGSHLLSALALGAGGVLVGRPALWGLALGGATGTARVLGLLRAELEDAMALAGCPDLAAAARLTAIH